MGKKILTADVKQRLAWALLKLAQLKLLMHLGLQHAITRALAPWGMVRTLSFAGDPAEPNKSFMALYE